MGGFLGRATTVLARARVFFPSPLSGFLVAGGGCGAKGGGVPVVPNVTG